MYKIMLFAGCISILLSCNQQPKEKGMSIAAIPKATELVKPHKKIKKENLTEDPYVEKNVAIDSTQIDFITYEKNGLAIPTTYDIYDKDQNRIGKLNIDSITPIKLIGKSLKKLPQFPGQDYCEWSNFIQLIYNNDTIIVFGQSILEILYSEKEVINDKTRINLVLASNFTMEVGDDNGITGCDDFSYIIIKSDRGKYSFIKDKKDSNIGVFKHNENKSEEISYIDIQQDTLILKIDVSYQEGKGAYSMKIFKDGEWFYTLSDKKEENE